MNPAQAEKLNRVIDEEVPLRDLINRGRVQAGSSTEGGELETSGGEPSLGSIIRENRRRKLKLFNARIKAQRRF